MTVESAWTDAVKEWAAHHDATNPARPPAGELSEPERQRYIAQSRRNPLCMVLAALDGETDPAQLGISLDSRDEFGRLR